MNRVLLINQYEIIRIGIKAVLTTIPNIKVIGETNKRIEIMNMINKFQPHIVVIDIQLQGRYCFDMIQKMRHYRPSIKIIVLGSFKNDLLPFYLLQAGAVGCISSDCLASEIVTAIRVLLLGKYYLSEKIAQSLALKQVSIKSQFDFEWLSLRELQITLLILAGKNMHEIADELYLSPKTTMAYRSQLFKKVRAKNDVQLILRVKELGLFETLSNKSS